MKPNQNWASNHNRRKKYIYQVSDSLATFQITDITATVAAYTESWFMAINHKKKKKKKDLIGLKCGH